MTSLILCSPFFILCLLLSVYYFLFTILGLLFSILYPLSSILYSILDSLFSILSLILCNRFSSKVLRIFFPSMPNVHRLPRPLIQMSSIIEGTRVLDYSIEIG